jgi:hypothetical protein
LLRFARSLLAGFDADLKSASSASARKRMKEAAIDKLSAIHDE